MKAKNALSLVLAAGVVTPAIADNVTPQLAPRGVMAEQHVAHIYFNLETGEKVATLLDGTRPADNGVSPTVWVADNALPCAAFGQTGGTSGVMDSPACTTCLTSTATGVIFLDWGDIATDSVIDCVGIGWSSQLQDTDTDLDGIGDGIEGFAGTWVWFDADDGFDSSSTRTALTGFTLTSLAGVTGVVDPNLLTVYTATVDLAATFSSSIVFEIGDTDSASTAPIFNAGLGADLDSDGNADFSYAFQYTQPGTFDFDNADGDSDTSTGVDGDPALAALTGWSLVAGNGDVDSTGTVYTPETASPGAIGIEDAFDFFIDTNSDGELEPIGTFFYGGFNCDNDPAIGNPFSQFRMVLYGPGGTPPCTVDLDGNNLLNFFDIQAFIAAYNADDLAIADIAAPFGALNFFDIQAFIAAYNVGCTFP
ncbi:MAG: hypothetical protein AB8F26_07610 [Phycisphaerales bacterium]